MGHVKRLQRHIYPSWPPFYVTSEKNKKQKSTFLLFTWPYIYYSWMWIESPGKGQKKKQWVPMNQPFSWCSLSSSGLIAGYYLCRRVGVVNRTQSVLCASDVSLPHFGIKHRQRLARNEPSSEAERGPSYPLSTSCAPDTETTLSWNYPNKAVNKMGSVQQNLKPPGSSEHGLRNWHYGVKL